MITVFILAVSGALFVYWLRYSAILILRSAPPQEYAQKVAAANHLSLLEMRQRLYAPVQSQNLPLLCEMLRKDLRVLKYVLRYVGGGPVNYTAQQRLLMINFRLATLWFRALYRLRPDGAGSILAEMSATVEYFSDAVGRRLALLQRPDL